MKFKNKTVIITGAVKGIGASCAEIFYETGACVILLDIVEPEPGTLNHRRHYLHCDFSKESSIKEAFQIIEKRFDTVDFLINNVGIQRYGTVTETSVEEWDLVFNVNLKSMFLCSKYAIPLMQKGKNGAIINVASVQAFVSQQKVAAYTSAKSAVLGLTRSIAVDYAPEIRCVAVCPGTINTPMLTEAISLSPNPDEVMQECVDMHPAGRIGKPQEVAELIAYLCEDKASFITGQAIRIDGGLGISIGGSKRN